MLLIYILYFVMHRSVPFSYLGFSWLIVRSSVYTPGLCF